MRARNSGINGLTYRVGRHLPGAAEPFRHMLTELAQQVQSSDAAVANGQRPPCTSILVLGRPGSGKSTLLRDVARILSSDLELKVVVVDSNMELGGGC
jgi:stage III sporulation protein SpoIIIAA